MSDFEVSSGQINKVYQVLLRKYGKRFSHNYLQMCAEAIFSGFSWKLKLHNNWGWVQPNLWYQMIRASGSGKSIILDNFIEPIFREVESLMNENSDKKRYLLVIGEYNHEAGINIFGNHAVDTKTKKKIIGNLGIIIQDENTMLQKAALNKGYMCDMAETDSKIYDRKMMPRFTLKRGLEGIPYIYKAKIKSTTRRFYSLMKNDDMVQGVFNRDDFDVDAKKTEENELLDDNFFARDSTEEAIAIREISERFFKYVNTKYDIVFNVDDKAGELWRNYEKEIRDEADRMEDKNLVASYLYRQAEKVLKRAMLYCASRNFNNLLNGEFEIHTWQDEHSVENNFQYIQLIIEEENMTMAIKNQRIYRKMFEKMLAERRIALSEPKNELRTDEQDQLYVEKIMSGKGIMSAKLLRYETHWNDGNTRWNTIITLTNLGLIRRIVGDEAKKILVEGKKSEEWLKKQMISPKATESSFYEWVGDINDGEGGGKTC